MQLVVTSSDTSMLVACFLGTYRGTDCQKSVTDVELTLLSVIPDAHCSSYKSHAHRRAWSAVKTTEINATSTHSTYLTSLSRMQQF